MQDEKRTRRLQQSFTRRDLEDQHEALKKLGSSAAGRRFLWLLLEQTRVFQNPFTGNALTSAFAAGEMNVGQRLLSLLMSASPETFTLMQKENQDEHERRARHFTGADGADDDDSD